MFTLPDLPYDYSALEPFIDTETMHIHHGKHHAAYVKNLNDLLADHDDLLNMDIDDLLKNLDKVPEEIRQKVKNNAGGVANHNMFWKIMCPASESKIPNEGKLYDAIISTFTSMDIFKEKFSAAALNRFGSGWVWLVVNKKINSLEIVDTVNQDLPFSISVLYEPLLCLDVWEHAYYLKYKNVRVEYIKAWWNVVNWKKVQELYEKAR